MKKLAILAIAALVAGSAFAGATGVGDSYISVNNSWYRGSGTDDWQGSAANAFNGYDLGTLTSLTLGGQLTIWTEENASGWGASWAGDEMGYRIEENKDNGAVMVNDTPINMTSLAMPEDKYFRVENYPGVDVSLSNLTDNESYKLVVWFGGVDNKWDSGNNFVATFTKGASAPSDVPEPATMSLLGLGALALVLRRKLRK